MASLLFWRGRDCLFWCSAGHSEVGEKKSFDKKILTARQLDFLPSFFFLLLSWASGSRLAPVAAIRIISTTVVEFYSEYNRFLNHLSHPSSGYLPRDISVNKPDFKMVEKLYVTYNDVSILIPRWRS